MSDQENVFLTHFVLLTFRRVVFGLAFGFVTFDGFSTSISMFSYPTPTQ